MSNDKQQEKVLWQEEKQKIDESEENDLDYFNGGEPGKNQVKFLEIMKEYSAQKQYDDEEHDYITFRIEVDGEELMWDMKKTYTESSKYGKIVRFGDLNPDGLIGETITWYRQGTGVDTDYVLMDLDDLEDGDDGSDDKDSDDGKTAIFDEDSKQEA